MNFSRPIPNYLVERSNIVRLILFTAAFALIFINIYSPFGASKWFNISKLEFLVYSSLVILTGVLVVVISRIVLYQYTRKGRRLSLGRYLIWIAVEVLSMSLFYTLYEFLILNDDRSFGEALRASSINTTLVLLLPYSVLWLYFSWRDKVLKLRSLTDDHGEEIVKKGMIIFRDEKGVMRLSIKRADVLYLKGADNYVTIYYVDHQKQSKFLLRNTLKKMEEALRPFDIIRCHRSYLVNSAAVKLIEREKEGLRIRLDVPFEVEVPVSKTYVNDVFQLFGQ